MAKKKPAHKRGETREDAETKLPTFSGFKPLAAGLGDLKAKLDAEQAKAAEARDAKRAAGKPAPAPPPPRAEKQKTAPAPTDARDDELTFHRMMSGVTPLEGRTHRVGAAATVEASPVRPADLRERAVRDGKDALDHLHRLVDDAVRFEVTDDGKRVEGRRLDAPPNLVRQLRHGALPIDARLDLHGASVDDARERLGEFLRTMRTRGERCVLVIHGKGEGRPTGGVLRGEMSAWLSQGPARQHVAAFATARDEDGGEGAVYVALRR